MMTIYRGGAMQFRTGASDLARVCLISCWLAGCLICAAQPAEPASQPTYHVGDQWTFANGSGTTHTQRVIEVGADAITVSIGKGQARVTRDFNFPRTYDQTTTLDQRMMFPMTLGMEWSSSFQWKAGNILGKIDVTRRVVAYERIKVRAGEFDAYRIEGSGYWKDLTTVISFQEYTGGPRVERYWYAPAAKRIVKFEGTNWITTQLDRIDFNESYELVEIRLESTTR